MRFFKNRSKAQAMPIVALLLVAFIGLLGLAIDLGRLYIARAELSRAIDAAALAGVIELPDTADAQAKASA
jgi:Flp pilus assembly protein TadG